MKLSVNNLHGSGFCMLDLSGVALEAEDCPSGTQTWPVRRHRRKASRGNDMPELKSLPVSVMFDMRYVCF